MHNVTAKNRLIHRHVSAEPREESHYIMGDSQTMGRLWTYYPWKGTLDLRTHTPRTKLDVDVLYTIKGMELKHIDSKLEGDVHTRRYMINGNQYIKLCDEFTKYRMGIERSNTGVLHYYNNLSNFDIDELRQWAGESDSPIDRSIFGYESILTPDYTNDVTRWDIIAPHRSDASVIRYHHAPGEFYARVTIDTTYLHEAKFWLLRGERPADGDSLYRRSFYGEYRRIFQKILGNRPVQSEQITPDQGLEYMTGVWDYLTSNEYLDRTNPRHHIARLYTWEAI
ncbi:hypothetical protein PBI_CANTARE_104 [Brevibacterium phage Cantare]|uniref:Uncharacterized protein n=1 Tax=Brevibacterium phage Cantare TaxID=2338395 RepID=A0A3G3LYV3_9CAUD|nr:hypothetical protein PQD70_gp104 [Brevibacterium phage Cantare]AYQ99324.1 hypothetical protein PBI_CANTARE_104 [Brevibacterium phage Cantare]